MSILCPDPIMDMQIWTVPQLKPTEDFNDKFDTEEKGYTDEELADIDPAERPRSSDDDYQDYINQEVNILNNK